MKFKTKLIAEIGSNHNRDITRCYKLIDEAKNLGFYAVKFQLFKINKLFSKDVLFIPNDFNNLIRFKIFLFLVIKTPPSPVVICLAG